MTDAVELDGITRTFGRTRALDAASFSLAPGLVHALLGPNGSGKTTAIDILTATRHPDAGRARVLGHDVRRGGPTAALVAVMPQALAFPEYLTVREVLALALVPHAAALTPAAAIDRFDLDRLASRQTGGLSGGERRRVALACVVGAGTPVVVLDEPSAALDIPGRAAVRDAIAAVRDSGRTVLLASHDMEEVAALADTVVCLDHGRVVGHWTAADFRGLAGVRRVGFDATAAEARRLRSSGAVPEAGEEPRGLERIRWVIDTDRSDVVAGLVLAAVPQPGLTVVEPGLGEIVERVLADGADAIPADPSRAEDHAGCAR
ncbi:ABC transporter ATP-binding protein [Clavibacter sepedonicus]|uniref:ABC transporter ATP-binding protein n=1 Tax=Clavibacter sepedonicus TaxID=31964 RepID=B0RD69_CLASE|nr:MULTISPECIES: ABC transporter ATP-binding protein [Clavibacter]MBD5381314.1 ABC transporter ATP-binding protein [Clavibacter sp.]OQJ49063.1 ABC transporter ATP-binding protein [Clavibacter sepedonicus]OQJ53632.1 ABC transporter ATP-binding protein [Clavibacter sepedonicus]UUK65118.1 ABC transporter ATP-binding protein [Clavibacter sepedonicus]CAQ00668.1 putative ABC transporter ATP-binding protein [Clavibacter sepedonicus]